MTGVQGDSGGPLVAQDEAGHGWSVVGLTSWGLGPGQWRDAGAILASVHVLSCVTFWWHVNLHLYLMSPYTQECRGAGAVTTGTQSSPRSASTSTGSRLCSGWSRRLIINSEEI